MGVNSEFNFDHAPEDAPNFCGDSGFRTKNTVQSMVTKELHEPAYSLWGDNRNRFNSEGEI